MSDHASQALFLRAQRVMPGGVNSPVRAFGAVGGSPVFLSRAQGAYVFGADGARYTDYVGSWGPMILGHANPLVVQAVCEAVAYGTSFGAPTEREVLFAEALCALYPSIQKMRAVSSGTEATMSAVRVARGYTGRDKVVKFEGCFHGHVDALLIKAGSGALTFGVPDSAGIPAAVAACTYTLPYNDLPALQQLFAAHGGEIAAVIVEPVVGNMGCVPPVPGFLEEILRLCTAHGAVSIFDEVMTGCRVARGGMQSRVGLQPDMTCLGKIVGGGLPLAVYGGRQAIMNQVAPLGPVYQSGTLSGNPVAVSAGLATLAQLQETLYTRLEALGAQLEEGLSSLLMRHGVEGCVQRVGSMFTLFFTRGPVQNLQEAQRADTARFARFHAEMLRRGQYWPPSPFEAAFVSGAHTEADLEATLSAADEALRT